jgi:hypothetical protein
MPTQIHLNLTLEGQQLDFVGRLQSLEDQLDDQSR